MPLFWRRKIVDKKNATLLDQLAFRVEKIRRQIAKEIRNFKLGTIGIKDIRRLLNMHKKELDSIEKQIKRLKIVPEEGRAFAERILKKVKELKNVIKSF